MKTDWPIVPIWTVADETRRAIDPAELDGDVFHYSIPVVEETGTGRVESAHDLGSAKLLLNGDEVLISKLNPRKGRVLIAKQHGELIVASPEFIALRPNDRIIDRFLAYLLASETIRLHLDANVQSVTRSHQRVTPELVRHLKFACPPLNEQQRIADFLDAETARIDGLRAKRIAQISVLDQLELARIGEHLMSTEATGPVYAYFDVQLGKMLNAERASGDNQQPYLRHANVHWYEIVTDDLATMTFEPGEWLRYSLRPGDLLVNEGGAGGTAEAAVWDGRIAPCFYQKSLHRVRARGPIPVEWLMYWLRYAKASGVFDAESDRATIPHLTGEKLAESRIPIPDDGHQRVSVLAAEIAAIRETQRKMEAANAVLAERRQALITAAVTGGITV